MQRIKKANLKLNPEKCKWFSERIQILGHIVSSKGIEMDEKKKAIIRDRKELKNVEQ